MSGAPLLELRRIVRSFGPRRVLDEIDFVVERGETVVVIGGSGSGKSTLARLLVGLDEPTSGQVLLEGEDLATLSARRRHRARARFGMVFQRQALLDSMSVYDNVAFPLRERLHLSAEEVDRAVRAQLELLDLTAAADRFPAELSGGMAKRVGIARAMVMRPEILVYDEPTSGLDPITSRRVDDLIEEVRERFLVTSIVITHDMMTALRIGDRVALLDHGRFAVVAPPVDLLTSVDPRVRPFIVSSGVDPSTVSPRRGRAAPAEIRRRWDEAHPSSPRSNPRERPLDRELPVEPVPVGS